MENKMNQTKDYISLGLMKEIWLRDVDFPREWSSGTTAIHLACQQGASEIYLMGFDLSENPLNNVYEEEQMDFKTDRKLKSDPHRFCHRSDWVQ